MRRLLGISALVFLLGSSAVAAFAQTAPLPAPSQLPPTQPFLGYGGSLTALADTNPDGTVGYRVDGRGGHGQGGPVSHGPSRCVGETPDQAGVSYRGLVHARLVTDTAVYAQPMFNGANLPLSGSVPDSLDAHEYIVVCGGVPVGYGFWVPAPAGPGPTPGQVQTIAQSEAGIIRMPSVTIESFPSAGGIDGLNTFFWTAGYTGGPIVETRMVLGVNVEVDATPTSFVWSFGDGTAITTSSLGVPWQPADAPSVPGRPDCDLLGNPTPEVQVPTGAVTHCYRTASAGPLTLSVTFNFAVSWRANGGPFQALPPIQRTAARSYPVQQIVSSVVARS